jgi:hypothetical protein
METLVNDKTPAKTPQQINADWLDQVNKDADAKAQEIAALMGCLVEAMVFVVEPGKDAAVAYLKKPDAMTAYEMMLNGRKIGIAKASQLIARAQLIRQTDIARFNPVEGFTASDPRFMDVEGIYLPENTDLNTGLLIEVNDLVSPIGNAFKKK